MTLHAELSADPATWGSPDRPTHGHDWRLRDVDFVDGLQTRRFECDGCGGVTFR